MKGTSIMWLVLSDTHKDEMNAIPHILKKYEKTVETIIHCGDIKPKHLNPTLFGNKPVYCALTDEQVEKNEQAEKKEFEIAPPDWKFTRPGKRIVDVGDIRIYLGHKRSFEFLTGSETKLIETLDTIRKDNDEVRWLFSGHTHHQIYKQGHLISFVNPGAVEDSFDGYEFAVIDPNSDKIVFSRIPRTKPKKRKFSVGVISDSLNISELDADFWKRLAKEFKKYSVKNIIHCGNISLEDIGREELKDFTVHYNLKKESRKQYNAPKNWRPISKENPIVKVNGYCFYVQFDLGAKLLEMAEVDMHRLSLEIRRQYLEINFILCGFTHDAFYEEGQEVKIVNPGDVIKDRNFAVISLPTTEITFAHVPIDPLPSLNH